MWNQPTAERLANIPDLYETESIPLKDKLIHCHFFLGNSDWYVAEFNGSDTFFGFVILNGNCTHAEWGYFTLRKLDQIYVRGYGEVEFDEWWQVRSASQVKKIAAAQGWHQTATTGEQYG